MFSPFRHLGAVLYKGQPIQLTFFLTRRCNSRCSFCFYLSEDRVPEPVEELTVQEIERLADSLGDLLWLAFSGGEIFLRKDLVEIAGIFYQRNRPAIMLFPTNGLLTERIRNDIEEILRNCPRTNVVVKLSLDGPELVHNSIRGVADGFKKTMATYEALGELLEVYPNFDLGINTVFCADNQEFIDEMIDFAATLDKSRTHTISLIRGDVSDSNLKQVDLGLYRRACDRLEAGLKSKSAKIYGFSGARLKAAQDILQRKIIYETAVTGRKQLDCFAGKLNLVLTETGELYPCESFTDSMGNVRDFSYDIGKMLVTKKSQDIVRQISETGCFCTHECYVMTNLLFNPWQHPKLIREYLRL